MKALKIALTIFGGGLAVAGIVTTSLLLLIVGVILTVGALTSLLFGRSQKINPDFNEQLGAEARWLLRPIMELRNSLERLATSDSSPPEVRVIAGEAVSEADLIYERSENLAKAREELKRSLKGRGEAETQIARIQRQIKESQTDEERQALDQALQSRQREIESYNEVQAKVSELESKIKVAEATLSELKARISAGMLSSSGISGDQDELSEMLQRLHSLGTSFEEAQNSLEIKN